MSLPKNYQEVFDEFLRRISSLFSDIILLTLTGSGGQERVINNWSDLDVLIVLKRLEEKKIKIIYKSVEALPIKIGLTIYSKEEFEEGLVDSKTVWNIQIIKDKKITPLIFKKDLKLPNFSKECNINIHRLVIPKKIHTIKRNLAKNSNYNIKSIAKDIDSIMKFAIFSVKGEIVTGYREVQDLFYNLFPECPEVSDVFEIIKGIDREIYYHQCWEFLNYLASRQFIRMSKYKEVCQK